MTNTEERRSARLERRRERARRELLDATRTVLQRSGVAGVTIEAVAHEAAVSKAAVYYYFTDKDDLLRGLCVDEVEAEVGALIAAVAAAPTGRGAIEALLRSFAGWHLDRLGQFRLTYLWTQLAGVPPDEVEGVVNPAMNALFDVLEARLVADREAGRLAPGVHPRRTAVSVFFAALGFVMAHSLIEASGTRLVHASPDLLDEMVGLLTRGVSRG